MASASFPDTEGTEGGPCPCLCRVFVCLSASLTCPGKPSSGQHDSWEPRDRCGSRNRCFSFPSLSPPPNSPEHPTSSRHDFEGAALVGDTVHRTWPLIRPLAKGHQLQVVDGWAQFSKPGSWGQSWRGLHTQPGDTLTRPGRTLRADPFWST